LGRKFCIIAEYEEDYKNRGLSGGHIMNKIYLIVIAIIIALAFNAGAFSAEAKVALSESEINSTNSAAKLVENESLETRMSSEALQSQSYIIEKNDVNIYLHKAFYVLTVLFSALIICILIAMQNDLFFLRKKEQKIKECYEFEVFASDQ
jgi:hypothetical protein